uniref:CDA1L1 1 n=1 Tax=Lethenteron camtschaticum TaxID=980415 RepID=A0A2P1IQ98_LETCA|nr:cytidine deaminase [Lethenteron camtschaticum]QSL97320.1 CDA1L1 4a [Lethenteron camtschaticum]QSL97322.1 CDA1L1 1 [Lethenteron camtschaticum]
MAGDENVRVSEKLDFNTFEFEFENLHYAEGRGRTYVIFDVKPKSEGGRGKRLWGYVRNNPLDDHAEVILMSKINDHLETHQGNYTMTWYMSWSPCGNCSSELVPWLQNLLEEQQHTLTMHFSRIYDKDRAVDHRGLRDLQRVVSNDFQMGVMGQTEVDTCLAEYVEASGGLSLKWLHMTEKNATRTQKKLSSILVRCAGMRESGMPLHLFT